MHAHTHTKVALHLGGGPAAPFAVLGELDATLRCSEMDQMGSALLGSLEMLCFLTGTFGVLPVNLLLSSQKCQGVPFSPMRQKSLLLPRPH